LGGTVLVAERFCGPSDSANGGYVSGLVAQWVGGAAEVELRRPPPLGTPMGVSVEDGHAEVTDPDDGGLVLRGRALADDEPDVASPPAVTLEEAREATKRYVGFERHPFPRCFTCGPEREDGDGLRIFPGQVAGREAGTVASPWRPHDSLADEDGVVPAPVVWAALDCPTGFTAINADSDGLPYVLARFAVRIDAPVHAGRDHVVVGWPLGDDGRKHTAASALLDENGNVVARSRALWIQLRS
jgi:hypothetical protein